MRFASRPAYHAAKPLASASNCHACRLNLNTVFIRSMSFFNVTTSTPTATAKPSA